MNNLAEQILYEDKGGKNLHLEHIEDEILNYGVTGGRASINFVRSLRDMFAGATRSSVNMTVKHIHKNTYFCIGFVFQL